ncbi:hypothetical protein D3C79_821370 [compost metagenome]
MYADGAHGQQPAQFPASQAQCLGQFVDGVEVAFRACGGDVELRLVEGLGRAGRLQQQGLQLRRKTAAQQRCVMLRAERSSVEAEGRHVHVDAIQQVPQGQLLQDQRGLDCFPGAEEGYIALVHAFGHGVWQGFARHCGVPFEHLQHDIDLGQAFADVFVVQLEFQQVRAASLQR